MKHILTLFAILIYGLMHAQSITIKHINQLDSLATAPAAIDVLPIWRQANDHTYQLSMQQVKNYVGIDTFSYIATKTNLDSVLGVFGNAFEAHQDTVNVVASQHYVNVAITLPSVIKNTAVAVNADAVASETDIASGYITSTSPSPTTITTPAANALAVYFGISAQGSFDLTIDNKSGASTVTLSAGSGFTYGSGGLTVAAGAVGIFRIVFRSPAEAGINRLG